MSRAKHGRAERDVLLERAETLIALGASVSAAAQAVGVRYSTLYNWRRTFCSSGISGAMRLEELKVENERLRRALLELEENAQD